MPAAELGFHEGNLRKTPIRDLHLTIAGTDLESILHEFERELRAAGIDKLKPRFYLSTEWGVPTDTIAIAIPFYLARRDLTNLHAEQTGFIEGKSHAEILRYLRHEMGHVVNYAYRLYDEAQWQHLFGDFHRPYEEEYHPEPFSLRFVRHLPGWYAQKHPDEDWAETFAVWLTPGRNWRAEYADRPVALAKLLYCDRTLAAVAARPPVVTATDFDEDVGELTFSLEQYYPGQLAPDAAFPASLDGAVRDIFENLGQPAESTGAARLPAGTLIRRLERDLQADVYRWTGHFPERTRALLRHLAGRAEQLELVYPEERETAAVVALTTLVTALAMNHVHRGTYLL